MQGEDMAYICCHARKIKTLAGLWNVARHNSREEITGRPDSEKPDWLVHRERESENSGDIGRGIASEVIRRRERDIAASNLKWKPQKNSAAAVEFVFQASEGWSGNQREFLNDCQEYIKKTYGHVIQAAAHFDEKEPHLHVLCVPITGEKYTSGHFLGGRQGLTRLQDEIYEQIGKKHGLDRGERGSGARHTDAKEWLRDETRLLRKEAAKKEAVIVRQKTELECLKKELVVLRRNQKLGSVLKDFLDRVGGKRRQGCQEIINGEDVKSC